MNAPKGNISLHDDQNHVLFDSIRVISEENDNLDLSQLEQESNNLMESIIKMDKKNQERQQSQEHIRIKSRSPNSLLRHSNQGLQQVSLNGMCGLLDSNSKKLGSGNHHHPPPKLTLQLKSQPNEKAPTSEIYSTNYPFPSPGSVLSKFPATATATATSKKVKEASCGGDGIGIGGSRGAVKDRKGSGGGGLGFGASEVRGASQK